MEKVVEELQEEMKVLKNEIKETLLDIRDFLLSQVENPFPVGMGAGRPEVGVPTNGKSNPYPESSKEATLPPAGPQNASGGGDALNAQMAEEDGSQPLSESSPGEAARAQDGVKVKTEKPADGLEKGGATRTEPVQSKRAAPVASANGGEAADMLMVATLAPWLEESISRIGHGRLKSIVEVYASMGGFSEQLKEVLLQLIDLDGGDRADNQVSLKECLRVMAELDNLVWRSRYDRTGAAVLSAYLTKGLSGS